MEPSRNRIHRIELPVPFPIKTVNAYVVDEEPITLVDPGVKTNLCFEILEESLRRLGLKMGDIARVLITHGHIDHYGQARRIVTLSHAEIYIHRAEQERIQSMDQVRENLESVLLQNGTPRNLVTEAMEYMHSAVRRYADPLGDVRFLDDGDEIPFKDMILQALVCPGHSPGLVCFYQEENGVLFSSDHLLEEISPNPIVDFSQKGPGPQSKSLQDYLNSLKKIGELDVSLVFPGHGRPIRDFQGALDRAFRHHGERLAMVLSVLSRGEMTAYGISKNLFPETRSFEVFLGVSEVLGHLRILVDEGKVVFGSKEGIDYYARA